MCETCDPYADCLPANTLQQLDALMSRVRQAEMCGELELLDGDPRLLQRRPGDPRPEPGVRAGARWLCSTCSRMFLLEVNSREALGDTWRPLFGN